MEEVLGLLFLWVPFALFSLRQILLRSMRSRNESRPHFLKYSVLTALLGLVMLIPWCPLSSAWYLLWIPVSYFALHTASDRLVILPQTFIVINLILSFYSQIAGIDINPLIPIAIYR